MRYSELKKYISGMTLEELRNTPLSKLSDYAMAPEQKKKNNRYKGNTIECGRLCYKDIVKIENAKAT